MTLDEIISRGERRKVTDFDRWHSADEVPPDDEGVVLVREPLGSSKRPWVESVDSARLMKLEWCYLPAAREATKGDAR